jgi:hypothetical protein
MAGAGMDGDDAGALPSPTNKNATTGGGGGKGKDANDDTLSQVGCDGFCFVQLQRFFWTFCLLCLMDWQRQGCERRHAFSGGFTCWSHTISLALLTPFRVEFACFCATQCNTTDVVGRQFLACSQTISCCA